MKETAFVAHPHGDALPMGVLPYGVATNDTELLMVMAGTSRFGDASFEQSIGRISAGGKLASAFVMPIDRFAAAAADIPPGDASIVYHVGRCGSTLLTRMLAVDPSLCVFCEPSTWAQLQRLATSWPEERRDADAATAGCQRLFSRFAADRGQQLIVKTTSWQVLHAPAIRAAGREVREVFLFRAPAPVVASNVAIPPGFADAIDNERGWPPSVFESWLPTIDLSRMHDVVDLFAELWRLTAEAVLELDGVLLIAYDELMDEPEATLRRVLDHFGIEQFPVDVAMRQRSFYAKSARRTERFDPAGTHQRRTLTPDEEARVAAITRDSEERLLAAWEAQRTA